MGSLLSYGIITSDRASFMCFIAWVDPPTFSFAVHEYLLSISQQHQGVLALRLTVLPANSKRARAAHNKKESKTEAKQNSKRGPTNGASEAMSSRAPWMKMKIQEQQRQERCSQHCFDKHVRHVDKRIAHVSCEE